MLYQKSNQRFTCPILSILFMCLSPAYAGEADILKVVANCNTQRQCHFSVTVKHSDEGWDHYANRWEILNPEREIIATRVLMHPHEQEQPFTRSLPAVVIPEGIEAVIVRAHDSVHEYGGKEMTVMLEFNRF